MKGMHADKQSASVRQSDVKKGHQAEKVSSVEKVGGPTGVRFPVHDHHEHCDVKGGGAVKTPGG